MTAKATFRFAIAAIVLAIAAQVHPSHAGSESCSASRDYILGGLAGELPQAPQSYKALFDICTATTDMFNVKDAFVLKDGAVGVIPKQDGIAVTATMLSEFCQRFPKATLRFITRSEQTKAKTVALTVLLPSTSSTPCRTIRGMS